MSYVSPIKIGYEAEPEEGWTDKIGKYLAGEVDNLVLESCVKVGCHVDKDELEKALRYDRGQYEKGFADGVLSATPKWIDASKRLPDKEGNYIVYETQNEEVCESLYYPQTRLKKDRWRDPWEGCSVFSVSHWMEMPEPPQEVKHEVDRC